jgi:hypothetical protein
MEQVFDFQRKEQNIQEETSHAEMEVDDENYNFAADFRSHERNEADDFKGFLKNYPSIVDNRYLFMTSNRRRKLISRNNSVVNEAIRCSIPEVVENHSEATEEVRTKKTWSVVKEVASTTTQPSFPQQFEPPSTPVTHEKTTTKDQPSGRRSLLRQHLGTPTHTAKNTHTDSSDVTDEEMFRAMSKKTSPNKHTSTPARRSAGAVESPSRAQKDSNPPQRQQNIRTRMCFRGESCNRRGTCTFAHNMDEFCPIECRFEKCRRFESSSCNFYHKKLETKNQYLERTALERPN